MRVQGDRLLIVLGLLAQLVERLFCKQEVVGSIPIRSTGRSPLRGH